MDSVEANPVTEPAPTEAPSPDAQDTFIPPRAPENGTNLYPELKAIPPSSSQPQSRETVDPAALYSIVKIDDSSLFNSGTPVQKLFIQTGDHIHVLENTGSQKWGIRIGPRYNPVIEVDEGMTLKREFSQYEVFSLNYPVPAYDNEGQVSRLTLVISKGQMVLDAPPNRFGFGAGWMGFTDQQATTTPTRIFDQLSIPNTFETWSWGRGGALLYLRNSDLANTLYMGAKAFFPPSAAQWRLYPGEVIVMPFEGPIVDYLYPNGNGASGLMIWCPSGTCNFDWMISRRTTDNPIGTPTFFPGQGGI